jgi:prevent-host-death family protein
MKTVSISELKTSLSRYLDTVRQGGEVVITDRGRPIARLSPVEGAKASEGLRASLVREGILSPPRKRRTRLTAPPAEGASAQVLAALLEERAKGR